VTDADLDVTCPRCGGDGRERFYGPCASCRAQLGSAQHGEARELVTERFEPAMHVTPNAVALKES
jgi:hypothetical protein